ncbi:hypothetical protein LTR56_003529 [Elasticomyces elasticus]|nr:hypothetical protein LTR22_017857 [Elasticomyces elasticus]KAK3655522.1 hypothetical protein LTR56_003529 [Elasticomyces elasticus]KAK4917456.1 hypothetical protein LTR49_014676 [Elasticomyces elasticus]KAK5752537.1 hypothetical protein LTS12_017379 [Elasticomyces elasticus]
MPYIEIKFHSDFAIDTKLDPPSEFSLDDYDIMIQQLKSFCHPKKTHFVHLPFYFHSKEVTELKEKDSTEYKFVESLNALANSRAKLRAPFAGYKNDSGEIHAVATQMNGPTIAKDTPLEEHPLSARFIDAPHGLLTLAKTAITSITRRRSRPAASPVQRRAYLLSCVRRAGCYQ